MLVAFSVILFLQTPTIPWIIFQPTCPPPSPPGWNVLLRMYRSIMRRKLGLLGKSAAAAAAAAAANAIGAPGSSSAATTAAAGVPGSSRPSWPLAGCASAEVCAAAAAVAAAPLQPGSGQFDDVDDKLVADLLALMEETGVQVFIFGGGGGGGAVVVGVGGRGLLWVG